MLYNNGLDNSQTRMLVKTPRCRRRLCKGKRKGVRGSEGPERTFVVRCLRPVVRAVMWRRGLGGGCGERQWVDLGGSRGEWSHLIWRIENIRPKPGDTADPPNFLFQFNFYVPIFDDSLRPTPHSRPRYGWTSHHRSQLSIWHWLGDATLYLLFFRGRSRRSHYFPLHRPSAFVSLFSHLHHL